MEILGVTMSDLKMCGRCKTYKPLTAFRKCAASKDGYKPTCSECLKKADLELPEKLSAKKLAALTAETKVCRLCKEEKLKKEFRVEIGNRDKLSNVCIPCYDGNRRAQYKKNPEPHLAAVKKWNENHPDEYKAIRDRKSKEFKAKNPLIVAAWGHATYALKTGRLIKEPCCICPMPNWDVEMHHPSHKQEHWLNVQWLCHLHHGRANQMTEEFKLYTKELDAEWEKRYQQGKVELVS